MCIDAINSGSDTSAIHLLWADCLVRMRSMAHSQQLRSDGPNPLQLIRRHAANHITSPFHVFKGSKAGPIRARVLNHFDCPPWMHIQVQPYGSYRAEAEVMKGDIFRSDFAHSQQPQRFMCPPWGTCYRHATPNGPVGTLPQWMHNALACPTT